MWCTSYICFLTVRERWSIMESWMDACILFRNRISNCHPSSSSSREREMCSLLKFFIPQPKERVDNPKKEKVPRTKYRKTHEQERLQSYVYDQRATWHEPVHYSSSHSKRARVFQSRTPLWWKRRWRQQVEEQQKNVPMNRYTITFQGQKKMFQWIDKKIDFNSCYNTPLVWII